MQSCAMCTPAINNELLPSLGSLGEVKKNISLVEVLEVFEKQKKEN